MKTTSTKAGAAPAEDVPADNAPADSSTRRRNWRILRIAALAGIVAVGIVAGATWLGESSLRDARAALEQNDPQRALALVSYFLESHPEHDQALAVKARALAELGEAEEALKLYEKIGAASPDEMNSWAHAYMATGQWSKALPLLVRATRLEPQNAVAVYRLTSCHVRMTNLEEAVAIGKKLREIPGEEVNGNITLAAIYFDLEDYEQSIKAYARATELSPDGSAFPLPANEAFFQYGSALLAHGQPEEAARVLEKSLANRPSAPAYVVMGNALSQAGQVEEAVHAWEMSLKLDDRNGRAREALANAALDRGDAQAALDYLKPLVAVREIRQSTAYLLNRIHTALGNTKDAEMFGRISTKLRADNERSRAIDQLIVRTPRSFWANVVRAHRFASEGNWVQAEELIEMCYQEAPEDAYVKELRTAIRKRQQLPSLDKMPLAGF